MPRLTGLTCRSCSKADRSLSNHQLVGKMKPGREFDSRPGHENFLCSKLKMFTGSVCVLLTSVSLKLIKIKIKLIYATTSS